MVVVVVAGDGGGCVSGGGGLVVVVGSCGRGGRGVAHVVGVVHLHQAGPEGPHRLAADLRLMVMSEGGRDAASKWGLFWVSAEFGGVSEQE